MDFKAIIFDMDGLLVDSEPVWLEVEVGLLESCGYRFSAELREMCVGMRVDEFAAILKRHYPKLGESPAAIEKAITDGMLSLPPGRILAMPGADALVNYFAELGIPRAIASSSSQAIIEHFVTLMGWDVLIPQRYSAEFMPRGKPAPDIYLHAAERLGCPPETCLALEDSPAGTQAALAAGMTCFTVPDRSHSSPADFADINDRVFGSLHEVMREIRTKRLFA